MKRLLLAALLTFAAGSFAAEATPQWPFDRRAPEELRKMERKVFAHYFSQFPISIDDGNPDGDYYAKGYLSPDGENGIHRPYGRFINQRPLPRLPRLVPDWHELDVYDEVRMAAETGMDGFAYNILTTTGSHWERLLTLMKQVNKYGKGFKILIMPDMTAEFSEHPERMVPALLKIAGDPSLYRDGSGKLVIAPYNAYAQPPQWWKERLAELKSHGVDVVFMPGFQGWWKYLKDYRELCWGFFDWGTSALDEQLGWRRQALRETDRYGKVFMAPVRPQDCRPRAGMAGEAHNSELFRAMWQTAIDYNAGWVQLVTWSDYSEGTEIAPSTGTRWAFYDLTAYYTSYFKTGKPPKIERDAIYWFHRRQHTDAPYDKTQQTRGPFRIVGTPHNEIELLGFLKAPGTLRITLNGKVHEQAFPAGMHSFKIPLECGRPEFSLVRDGRELIRLTGHQEIVRSNPYQDMLYYADGGTAEAPRIWTGPEKKTVAPELGKLIRQVSFPGFPLVSGKGGKPREVGFGGSFRIPDESEAVFHVRRMDVKADHGWVALFLSAATADGRSRFNLTPRTAKQTYISGSHPGTPFRVVRDNFQVEYPAIYRLRRSGGKLQFLYGNYVVAEVDEKEYGKLDRPSISISAEKPEDGGLLEFSAIELRRLP